MRMLLLALLGVVSFQSTPAGLAGVWVAEHQGTTFVRLEITANGTTIAGAIGTGNLTVDDKGIVTAVTAVPAALTPLRELVLNGASLSFVRPEGDDLEQFRLSLVGTDQADLTFIPSEEMLEEIKDAGIAVPKPIRLRKIR